MRFLSGFGCLTFPSCFSRVCLSSRSWFKCAFYDNLFCFPTPSLSLAFHFSLRLRPCVVCFTFPAGVRIEEAQLFQVLPLHFQLRLPRDGYSVRDHYRAGAVREQLAICECFVLDGICFSSCLCWLDRLARKCDSAEFPVYKEYVGDKKQFYSMLRWQQDNTSKYYVRTFSFFVLVSLLFRTER